MQSYDSIKAFCARANKLRRLDAVLANAGIMTKYFKIVAGYESTITTNVIGTFLLALGVLPKLKESAAEYKTQSRLSIVASDLHFIAKFQEGDSKDIFAALNDEKSDMSMERLVFPSEIGCLAHDFCDRYAVSKLIQVYVVRELASRIAPKSSNVIINCMTPGACQSDFNRESAGIGKLIQKVMEAVIARYVWPLPFSQN